MPRIPRRVLLLLSLAVALITPMVSHAQSWTLTYYDFSSNSDLSFFPTAPSVVATNGSAYWVTNDTLFSTFGSANLSISNVGLSGLCFEGVDGNLYGVNTSSQMAKVTLAGVVTTFSTAQIVNTCPILANDGNYYGGSSTGGQYNYGYLYEINSTTGASTVFYNFTNTFDGKGPTVPLVQGSDGNLYGISSKGWFRYSASDGISVYDDGLTTTTNLQAPIEGVDGNFYTLTASAIQQVTPTGTVSTFYTPAGEYGTPTLSQMFPGGDGGLWVLESDSAFQGNTYTFYGVSVDGQGGGEGFTVEGPALQSYTQSMGLLPLGNGSYYGGYYLYSCYEDQCSGGYEYFVATSSTPPSVPVALTPSATHVVAGGTVKLSWSANKATSDTSKQCYGYGALSGKLATTGSVNFNPAAGTYTAAIVCGGTVENNVSITAGNAPVSFYEYQTPTYAGVTQALGAQIYPIGTPAPTAPIQFKYGNQILATAPLTSAYPMGVPAYAETNLVRLSTTGIAPGTYEITAYYPGDANYGPGSQTVAITFLPPAASTTAVSPATQSLDIDSTVSLTATVTGSNANRYPTGTVTFTYASTVLSTASLSGSGQVQTAKLSEATTGLAAGTYVVGVNYSGDPYNAPSSTTATVTLTQPKDTVAVTASANPVAANTAFNLTATATGISKTPTGTVVFYAGTTALSGASLNGSGMATVTIPAGTLAAGSYQVTAEYLGDSNNPATTSPAITLTVQ